MRISKEVNTLERGEVGAETTFRIQANARAFSILSSNLYTDKIKAVIRELSCNAWDSHVAAGKQGTPFDVHLPNNLEPWFSVTDYGLGLSHEQVMDLYTTYFSSTKSDSKIRNCSALSRTPTRAPICAPITPPMISNRASIISTV